jgi:hypothetical protein
VREVLSVAEDWPRLIHMRQRFEEERLEDVGAALEAEMCRAGILDRVSPDSKVIIAAGSRGIPNYPEVILKLVGLLQRQGARVSILPAMGCHGGGHAQGQIRLLEGLGITPASVNAPIIDTMEEIVIGKTPSGIPVYADKTVTEAEHIIVVNRIKEHTEFHGGIQSGLLKMMAVGLGRCQGAITTHNYAVEFGYEQTIREVARACIERLPILAGVALIDAPQGDTAAIRVLPRLDIERGERELLAVARCKTLGLPLENVDLLIVDEMGKNISGTGMDTKVIGRIMNIYEQELTSPHITRIFVRDLSPVSQGNAIGIGLADFTTQRLVDKIDLEVTNLNTVTAVTPEKGRIPLVFPTDRQALSAAFRTLGPKDSKSIRLLWIKNTSSLVDLMASPAACSAIDPELAECASSSLEMRFDQHGNLIAPWQEE